MSEFQREARFFAELPVMPLREVVMLPRTIMPLFVGREASIKAIELAQSGYNRCSWWPSASPMWRSPAPMI